MPCSLDKQQNIPSISFSCPHSPLTIPLNLSSLTHHDIEIKPHRTIDMCLVKVLYLSILKYAAAEGLCFITLKINAHRLTNRKFT